MEHLGHEIAKVRREQGRSLRDIAAVTKLSPQKVLDVERGEGRLETMFKVAKSLGIRGSKLVQLATADLAQMAQSA